MTDYHVLHQISAYLDSEMTREECQAFEFHVATCETCRCALDDFRAIQAWARSYQAPTAPTDPWNQLAPRLRGRLRPPVRVRKRLRRRFGLAACVVLLVTAGGVASWMSWQSGASSDPSVVLLPPGPIRTVERPQIDDMTYAQRLAELEALFGQVRHQLDPRTVEVIEESMHAIDEALERITQALEQDPDNTLLHRLQQINRNQRLDLLQDLTRSL